MLMTLQPTDTLHAHDWHVSRKLSSAASQGRNCEKWYEVASLRTEQPETIKMKALVKAMQSVSGQTDCACMENPASGRQQNNGQQHRLFVCCFVCLRTASCTVTNRGSNRHTETSADLQICRCKVTCGAAGSQDLHTICQQQSHLVPL